MYKKILAGLDGSKHGIEAARAAVELARTFDAELHLLTVTRPYKVSPELRQFLEAENLLGEPKYVMDDMTNSIVSEAKDVATKAGLEGVVNRVVAGGYVDGLSLHPLDRITHLGDDRRRQVRSDRGPDDRNLDPEGLVLRQKALELCRSG